IFYCCFFFHRDRPHPIVSSLSLHDALSDLLEFAPARRRGLSQLRRRHRLARDLVGRRPAAGRAEIFSMVNALQPVAFPQGRAPRSEEHTSELQSRGHLGCRLLLEKKKKTRT